MNRKDDYSEMPLTEAIQALPHSEDCVSLYKTTQAHWNPKAYECNCPRAKALELARAAEEVIECAGALEHYIARIGHQSDCFVRERAECDCYQLERQALKRALNKHNQIAEREADK